MGFLSEKTVKIVQAKIIRDNLTIKKGLHMKGVVFVGDRKIEMREFADPTPGPNEVVLEIKASGMCGSDLKYYRAAPGEATKALGFAASNIFSPNL